MSIELKVSPCGVGENGGCGWRAIGLPPWKVVANAVQLADSPVCVFFACAMTRQPGTYDPNVIAVMKACRMM